MSDLIISVSGLRGIVGETLTPDVAARFAATFASGLPGGPIVVGRDGRSSGQMLRHAVIAGMSACGRDCIDADLVATPTVGVLVRERRAAGAVQITASHNPPPYNGIKLFGADGRVLNAGAGAAVRERYLGGQIAWTPHHAIGKSVTEPDPHATHLEKVLETVDVAAIRKCRFRVLLDSNHGAGSILGQRLLSRLGCEITLIGGNADGQFEHVPEPTAENLAGVAQLVREHQCSVGFCQDPDADRLALIDEQGRYIGEEYTLALCVQRALKKQGSLGPVVINGATSGMSERLAGDAGVPVFRSAVGEANVADLMIAKKATYGGEGNGGPIDPRVGYVRDSFVGIAQILDLMTTSQQSLSQLADALPQLHIHKAKVTLSAEELPRLLQKLPSAFPDAEPATGDGLRLAWPDKWLLVRGSNTEPIVRFIAEAESEAEAKRLCSAAAALL